MSIRFDCVKCGKKLKAHFDQGGSLVKCTACEEVQRVPTPEVGLAPAPEEPEEEAFIAPRKGASDDELDMTPMIDMTFLLLIFFMVTATFALQMSMPVPPPKPKEEGVAQTTVVDDDRDDDEITVRIDSQSEFWVMDHRVATRQELISQLRDARDGVGGPPCRKLMIEAHGEARHESVVIVLDAGTEVGMSQISLKSVDEDS